MSSGQEFVDKLVEEITIQVHQSLARQHAQLTMPEIDSLVSFRLREFACWLVALFGGEER